jgi:hypothetical protein
MHGQPAGDGDGSAYSRPDSGTGQVITHFGLALRLNGDLRVVDRLIELKPPSNIRMIRLTRPMALCCGLLIAVKPHVGSVATLSRLRTQLLRHAGLRNRRHCRWLPLGRAQPDADGTANDKVSP